MTFIDIPFQILCSLAFGDTFVSLFDTFKAFSQCRPSSEVSEGPEAMQIHVSKIPTRNLFCHKRSRLCKGICWLMEN